MADVPFLGCKISLISKCDIRYEGILYQVNPKESTIALSKVRSYGTESRGDPAHYVAPKNDVYDIIIFRASDVKDLRVDAPEPPGLSDPAIISAHHRRSDGDRTTDNETRDLDGGRRGGASAGADRTADNLTRDRETGRRGHADRSNDHDTRDRDHPSRRGGADRTNDNEARDRDDRSGRRGGPDRRATDNDTRDRDGGRRGDRRNDHETRDRDGGRRTGGQGGDRRDDTGGPRRGRGGGGGGDDRSRDTRVSRGGYERNNHNHVNSNMRYNNHNNYNSRRGPNNRDNNYNKGGPPYRRGGMQGGRRTRSGDRTGAPRSHPRKSAPLKFEGEFDFDENNKLFMELESKFKGLKLNKEAEAKSKNNEADGNAPKSPAGQSESGSGYDSEDQNNKDADSKDEFGGSVTGEFYDKTKSFFDNISCEASERSQGKVNKPNWRKEREINAETFGVSASHRRGGYHHRR